MYTYVSEGANKTYTSKEIAWLTCVYFTLQTHNHNQQTKFRVPHVLLCPHSALADDGHSPTFIYKWPYSWVFHRQKKKMCQIALETFRFSCEVSVIAQCWILYWLCRCCPWRGGWAAVSGAPSSRSAGWTWCGPFLASGLLPGTKAHSSVSTERLSDRTWRRQNIKRSPLKQKQP